jgi:hypothetical protein
MANAALQPSGMSMTTAPVSAHVLFNRKLIDFLVDLEGPVQGKLPSYTTLLASVKALSKIDEAQNQIVFDRYVARPYEDKILAKDERFFMGTDYGMTQSADSMGIVSILKAVWADLGPDDKEAIWAHLKVLVVLNRRCVG